MKKLFIGLFILAIIAALIYLIKDEANHNEFAKANNCEWHYLSNGFEVCK